MSDTESEEPKFTNKNVTLSAEQFQELIRMSLSNKTPNQPTSPKSESFGEVRIAEKLNGENYSLWAKLMKRAIGGKDLTSHISGVSDPPPPTDPNHARWQQRDHCCFNWIIGNIDTSLINEVSQYETARDLWDGLATTYGSGADQFQVSDLHRQAYSMKQGAMSLENLWQKFQDLWISIDSQDPNPMDTPSSIEKYNRNTQKHRLYQFVWALDSRYDKIKREILNMEPIPTARKAYGLVRREAVNDKLMNTNTEPQEVGVGVGLAVINQNRPSTFHRPTTLQSHQPPRNPAYRKEEDKSHLVCSHCKGKRHTKETCFHIHGFPEWWEEMKKSRQPRGGGRIGSGGRASAAIAVDRATYADKSAGGIDSPSTSDGNRKEEKAAVASVSIAKVWSEGEKSDDSTSPIKIVPTTAMVPTTAAKDPTVVRVRRSDEGETARVSGNGGRRSEMRGKGAARVSEIGGGRV